MITMSRLKSITGHILQDCNICNENEASWEMQLEEKDKKDRFYLCYDCASTLVKWLAPYYPKELDIPYLFYLVSTKINQTNPESDRIQKEMEELIAKVQNEPKGA